ncbi:hypothetical protein EXIGLDRAFT_664264 [Exidia glandulosa HHB12029]|uniref:EamA domain-containing protein n=1 Tax=Exidia glandulosa HHB12029 TaxID=1314781 RepID=A0A165Q653_EXIGL|nr:hypothetical protein EXIGLDRAFT_664264 [Exidia glandulosa HHB12029]
MIAFSQLFGSTMQITAKFLNGLDPPVPPFELIIVRMSLTYLASLAYMLWAKVPDPITGPKEVRWILVARGVCGFFGLFGVYYSLQYLSVSDTVVLTFLIPGTTAFVGHYFMGESYSRGEAIACGVSLFGVILIARPAALFGGDYSPPVPDVPSSDGSWVPSERGTPMQRLSAVGVSLLGVLGATGAYVTLRKIGKRAHPLHSMNFFAFYSTLVASLGMIVTRQPIVVPKRPEFFLLLLVLGLCGFFGQLLLVLGLQRETASRGALGLYAQIIFAVALERIFFDVKPSAMSIIGGLIIVGAALYVALTKKYGEPVNTEQRKSAEEEVEGTVPARRRVRWADELVDAEEDDEDEDEAAPMLAKQSLEMNRLTPNGQLNIRTVDLEEERLDVR